MKNRLLRAILAKALVGLTWSALLVAFFWVIGAAILQTSYRLSPVTEEERLQK